MTIGRTFFFWFLQKETEIFLMYNMKYTQYRDRCMFVIQIFLKWKKEEIFLLLVQIICSYTSAELEAFLQHITIMMNRRTRTNAPKAEAQIMTASSHVITLSVQWVPSYRKNSSCVHLTKETEFVWICCCLYFCLICLNICCCLYFCLYCSPL